MTIKAPIYRQRTPFVLVLIPILVVRINIISEQHSIQVTFAHIPLLLSFYGNMASLISLICLLQALRVNASFQPGVPGDLLRRQAIAPVECTAWAEVISLCSSEIPNFASAPSTEQAECLCYEGTSWVPSIFDGWVATCASWAKPATPQTTP